MQSLDKLSLVFQVYLVDLAILVFRVILDFQDKKILDIKMDFHIG